MQTQETANNITSKMRNELKNKEWKDTGDKEIWKPINGYEKLYKISNYGMVKSLIKSTTPKIKVFNTYKRFDRILKPALNTGGYYIVTLSKNNHHKTCVIHRLVAQHFIPNIDNKPQVNHIDGNKLNNNSENLEWATAQENSQHAIINGLTTFEHLRGENHKSSKLTETDVNQIRHNYYINNDTLLEIADKFKICSGTAHEIVTFKMWKHITKNYNLYMSMKDKRRKFHNSGEKNVLSKLKTKQVKEIRKLYSTNNYSISKLSFIFKTSKSNISSIINYHTWKNI